MRKDAQDERAEYRAYKASGGVESVREDEEVCWPEELREVYGGVLVDRVETVLCEVTGRDVVEKVVEGCYYWTSKCRLE